MTFLARSILLLINLIAVRAGTCKSYYYQRGPSDDELDMWPYDHNDSWCTFHEDATELKEDQWKSISASNAGKNTIQAKLAKNFNEFTCFFTCGGITQASACSGAEMYKSGCDKYYVVYPADTDENSNSYPKICPAELNSDGSVATDSDGRPYGDCHNCNLQSRRRVLRGSAVDNGLIRKISFDHDVGY